MLYQGKQFKGTTVELDGNQFLDCTFYDCKLVFNAYQPVTFERCVFDECDWVFDGYAEIMLSFLTALYHGLGESGVDLVNLIFDGVRDRKFVGRPVPPQAVAS